VHCSATLAGRVRIDGNLDAEGGGIVSDALDGIADDLWRQQHGEQTMGRPGRAELLADALVEMARRATTTDGTAGTAARPLISVICDLSTLEGRAGRPVLVDGGTGTISAEAARRLACDADVHRFITDPDGAILDMGRRARTATRDQRTLLALRDRHCRFPGCDMPPGWCQATTSSGGSTAAPPTSARWSSSAAAITTSCTKAAGACSARPTAACCSSRPSDRPRSSPSM